MKILKFAFLSVFMTVSIASYTQSIEKIEPPTWWIGLKTQLQLMVYGKDLKNASVISKEKNIKIINVYNADSDNYIFVDIKLGRDLKPGKYELIVNVKGKTIPIEYTLNERRLHSNLRDGFSTKDMIYLLMPDRFANGDSSNDSVAELEDKYSPNNPIGRHGGDIQGIINSLDYLQSLGVTTIWPTPVLFDNEPKVSYHGYACADYYKIDPRYGNNDLYREFVAKSKDKNIKIIFDFVPNHCGINHWWIDDLPFKSWINQFPQFTRSNYAMTTHSDRYASDYDKNMLTRGWFDYSMPDMNLENSYVLKYFTQNIIWWIEWADLSGVRIDTYPYSDKKQISALTKSIIDEYPNLKIVAESWYHSPSEVAYWEKDANNIDKFKSNLTNVMDFPLQDAIIAGFPEDSVPGWGEGMFRIYRLLSQDFVYKNPFDLLIFADNHDTNRISEIVKSNPAKLKMILTLIATMRGIPQLYYGTEFMLATKDGKLGHGEERLNMPGGWSGDSKNVFKNIGLDKNESDILSFTKMIFNWRKNSLPVSSGTLKHFWPNDNLYVYFRALKNEEIMVVINNNDKPLEIDWNIYRECTDGFFEGYEVISKKIIKIGDNLIIEPQSSLVIEFKGKINENSDLSN